MADQPERQRVVLEVLTDAWKGYTKYCGMRQRQIYEESSKGWFGRDPICNVIASMGTLWITNERDEFQKAEDWLKLRLDITKLNEETLVNYFITNYLGGLLEVYALTKRLWYLDKARDIAVHIGKAYQSPSGKWLETNAFDCVWR